MSREVNSKHFAKPPCIKNFSNLSQEFALGVALDGLVGVSSDLLDYDKV